MKIDPIPPINRREMRARHLASSLVRELEDFVPRDSLPGAHGALFKLFMSSDAEVITSADRIAAGLPERNEFGLTPDEHRAVELQRLHILTASPTPIFFCADCPNKPGSATPQPEGSNSTGEA